MKTKDLAIVIVFASLYAVLVFIFQTISFLSIQVRVANCLLALIPLFGLPSVYGITIGLVVGNFFSPLGVLDFLSVIPTFIGALLIYKSKYPLLSLLLYNIIIATWLTIVFGIPVSIATTGLLYLGLSVANVGIGYPIYGIIKKYHEDLWRNR